MQNTFAPPDTVMPLEFRGDHRTVTKSDHSHFLDVAMFKTVVSDIYVCYSVHHY